jgi:hypothetical protein
MRMGRGILGWGGEEYKEGGEDHEMGEGIHVWGI